MENAATRQYRWTMAAAAKEYREGRNDDPEVERRVAHDVAERYDITQNELRERAAAGA